MLPFEDRFTRQRRLPEVGPGGQARIAAASASIAGYEGSDVEREYLLRAGFGSVDRRPDLAPAPFPFEAELCFEASRAVARGAWNALAKIRAALGLSGSSVPGARP
jgi:hypothetical protein